jgi:phytoene/squalene synthetase
MKSMDILFNNVCDISSEIITKKYSTSFSMGIMLFEKSIRRPIYNLYGFVRFADEIVDTYEGEDKAELLERFRNDTFDAIKRGVSFNPVLHSFQDVVNEYNIDHNLIHAFLDSMAMDLHMESHNDDSYKKYIYGSAEVVGLMCLKIFVNKDNAEYERLKPFASALGSAFQKVNFLRDIKSDYKQRGRVYFPDIDFENFSEADKHLIEADIAAEFDYSREGIKQLPKNCRLGVYSAYKYYLRLFQKIKTESADKILESRVRVPNSEKLFVLTKSAVRISLNML